MKLFAVLIPLLGHDSFAAADLFSGNGNTASPSKSPTMSPSSEVRKPSSPFVLFSINVYRFSHVIKAHWISKLCPDNPISLLLAHVTHGISKLRSYNGISDVFSQFIPIKGANEVAFGIPELHAYHGLSNVFTKLISVNKVAIGIPELRADH
jgi:hypothetical protein